MFRMQVPWVAGVAALWIGGCGDASGGGAAGVQIHVAASAADAAALSRAADDLASLFRLYGDNPRVLRGAGPERCRDGEEHIVLLSPQLGGTPLPVDDPQQFRVAETRCAGGRLVLVRGGSVASGQWGAYWLAEALGVRYLHPEQAWYPSMLRWPDLPVVADEAPSVRARSFRVDPAFPTELSPPVDRTAVVMGDHVARWVTWNLARRQTSLDGVGGEVVDATGWERGLRHVRRLSLLGTAEGGLPALDADDPRSEDDQLAAALDAAMADAGPSSTPLHLEVAFHPAGIGQTEEEPALERMEYIAGYMAAAFPGVTVSAIHPGIPAEAGAVFGISYYELPSLARPELGLTVQPMMYYGVSGPSPAYTETEAAALRELIADQSAIRLVSYSPSNSWWRTFDLPVPLFLAPTVLEARQQDLEVLAPLLATRDDADAGVIAHLVQTSGQEWGYWLADVCTAEMTWDIALRWEDCVDWVFAGFAGRDAIVRILSEVADRQVVDMANPGIVRMFVGDDARTAVNAALRRAPHPLPPSPTELLGLTDAQAATFRSTSLEPLTAIAGSYHVWADEMESLRQSAPASDTPWLRELRDGLRIMALRAEFAYNVYSGMLAVREVYRTNDPDAALALASWQEQARQVLLEATAVVGGRASDYRYPEALNVAGDELGTPGALSNTTTYPYRVLSRVRRLYHWVRPLEQLDTLVAGVVDAARSNARILPLGQALVPQVLAPGVVSVSVDWGDGTSSDQLEPHVYTEQGLFTWTVSAARDDGALEHTEQVAVVERRYEFVRGALQIVAPELPESVAKLLPGVEVGVGRDSAGDFVVLGVLTGAEGDIRSGPLVRLAGDGSESLAADVSLPLPELGTLTIRSAVVTLVTEDGRAPALRVRGEVDSTEVVQRMVGLGGVSAEAASSELATLLGVTPALLPGRIPVEWLGEGSERPFE